MPRSEKNAEKYIGLGENKPTLSGAKQLKNDRKFRARSHGIVVERHKKERNKPINKVKRALKKVGNKKVK